MMLERLSLLRRLKRRLWCAEKEGAIDVVVTEGADAGVLAMIAEANLLKN